MSPDAYRRLYLEPILSAAAPSLPDPARIDHRHWYAPPAKAGAELALRDLFEVGVQRGHAGTLGELGRRVALADRDLAALPELLAHARRTERELADFHRSHAGHVRQLEQAVQAARADELAIKTSTFWRLTEPMRWSVHQAKLGARFARDSVVRTRLLAPRVGIAWQILRDSGPRALAARVAEKLRGRRRAGQLRTRGSLETAVAPLSIACSPSPRVSVIVPTYGQDLYTFTCLKALARDATQLALEVIVMDDAAPLPAAQALAGVEGVRFERNDKNLGFIGNCNRGASLARGEFLLFLNNDAVLGEGALAALLDVFDKRADAGAAGAKLVYPDGRLQEAGGIVWRDASAWNYGRDDDPAKPEYNYLREADYCSGACLLVRREDFLARGGFDTRFAPAYYEDTDFCFQLRAAGRKVYYQPLAEVVHFEGRTHGTDEASGMKRHQVDNRARFYDKWRAELSAHRANGVLPRLERDRAAGKRVLFVEACMLTPDQDSGSVRTWRLLQLLRDRGCKVTFVADNLEHREPYASALEQEGIELLHHPHVTSLDAYLEEHGEEFDMVVLARYYVATRHLDAVRRFAPRARLVFDTIDLHFLRTRRHAELENSRTLANSAQAIQAQEMRCIQAADVTWVVSEVERELLSREAPNSRVVVLSNIHDPAPKVSPFASRAGILFVGGFRHPPNVDAVIHYARDILPLVRRKLPGVVTYLVGSQAPRAVLDLACEGLEVVGFVPEVEPWLERARILVSPLRYGAGVKGKINQAMGHGLPVVATPVSVEGMHLLHERDVLVAEGAEGIAGELARLYADETLWSTLSEAGRDNVRRHFSPDVAARALDETWA